MQQKFGAESMVESCALGHFECSQESTAAVHVTVGAAQLAVLVEAAEAAGDAASGSA